MRGMPMMFKAEAAESVIVGLVLLVSAMVEGLEQGEGGEDAKKSA